MIGRQIIEQWTNHLWQSTLFAVMAALLTLAFSKNRAQVRYCVWLSASIKFLVPFGLLMNLSNSLWSAFAARGIATELASPSVSLTVQQIAQPFTDGLSFVPSAPLTHTAQWIPIAMLSVWLCGFLGVVLARFRGCCAAGCAFGLRCVRVRRLTSRLRPPFVRRRSC
jgi:bla regulator protein BlaR1